MMKAALHTAQRNQQRNHLSAGERLVRTGVGSSFDRPWRWLLSETRQVAALQFFIEKSGNLEGSRPLRRVVHRRRSLSDERIALGGSPFKTIA
jgi:hypothetical protein